MNRGYGKEEKKAEEKKNLKKEVEREGEKAEERKKEMEKRKSRDCEKGGWVRVCKGSHKARLRKQG